MLRLKVSAQDQQLYQLIGLALVVALFLGFLSALIGFGSDAGNKVDNWQSTVLKDAPDTLTEFAAVNNESRWFTEKSTTSAAQAAEAAKKALIGEPESLKLIGIVERSGKQFALFIPVESVAAIDPAAKKGVSLLTEGDVLVGDWKIKEISSGKVTVVTGAEGVDQQTRSIMLYQAKKS